MSPNSVASALLGESIHRLREESLPRIERCLGLLSEEEVWSRPNQTTNSVGNLVIHLSGNVRQWITAGLGGKPNQRDRDSEFAARGPRPKAEIVEELRTVVKEACAVLEEMDPSSLLEERMVQGFSVTGVSILVHVVEHFSYHTGQITYRLKSLSGVDTDYYNESARDLNAP